MQNTGRIIELYSFDVQIFCSIRPFKIFLQMTRHEIEANRKIKIVRLWLDFMFLICRLSTFMNRRWSFSAVSNNKILTVKAFWSCNGKWRSTSYNEWKKFWLCFRSPLKGTNKKKELQETLNYHKIKSYREFFARAGVKRYFCHVS